MAHARERPVDSDFARANLLEQDSQLVLVHEARITGRSADVRRVVPAGDLAEHTLAGASKPRDPEEAPAADG
jgi:hypothetical protein